MGEDGVGLVVRRGGKWEGGAVVGGMGICIGDGGRMISELTLST